MSKSYSRDEILAFAELDTDYAKHMETNPKTPAMSGPVQPVREAILAANTAAYSNTPPDVKIQTSTVTNSRSGPIPVTIWSPAAPVSANRPLVVFIHGGGFIVGSPIMDSPEAQALVQRSSAVCVGVDYGLAPENPFPGPVYDCWDALRWAANVPPVLADLGANPKEAGFVLVGSSSGANLACAVSYLALHESLAAPLSGLVLRMPELLKAEHVPEKYREQYLSWEQCKDADALPRGTIEYFTDLYQPDANSPLFSPFAQTKGHKGLPPVYLQVCGLDPLRDDGLIYERLLREEGVTVTCDIYKGLPHGFFAFYPSLTASPRFREDTIKSVQGFLST